MAMFNVLWASTNPYPLTSKEIEVENLRSNFHVHPKTCHFPNLSNILWYWEEGRLVFPLYVASCQAVANICYLFGPFQHVITTNFHIPLSGLGFQAAWACTLAILMKTMCLEIW